MLSSYLKTAYRSIARHKGYSLINVFGLTLGLAVCIVIGLFVLHKLSYDRFHPDADRMVRVYVQMRDRTPGLANRGLAAHLAANLPEIEAATAVLVKPPWGKLYEVEGTEVLAQDVFRVDDEFLTVFPFPLIRGDAASALTAPGRMVLTESLARRLFGDEDPIGRTVTYDNETTLEVTGLMADVPSNAHFGFEALMSLSERERTWRYGDLDWPYLDNYLYLRLREGVEVADFQEKLATFFDSSEKSAQQVERGMQLAVMPVTAIHLASPAEREIAPQGDPRYLVIFSAVAVLILLIACVNYMNLATARSVRRAREVGLRRVAGASRGQLVGQFIGEAILVSLIAMPLALETARRAVPWMNGVTGEGVAFSYTDGLGILAAVFVLVLVVGIVSGSYPAFYLSAIRPSEVLRGSRATGGRGGFRRGLVVFQFAASIVLVTATVVVHQQMEFVQQARLGFDEEQVVVVDDRHLEVERHQLMQNLLLRQSRVSSVAFGTTPGLGGGGGTILPSEDPGDAESMPTLYVDGDFPKTLGLEFVAGRGFTPGKDLQISDEIVLTEAAVRRFGLQGDALGQVITTRGDVRHTITGVVKDFHNGSLHQPVQPTLLTPLRSYYSHDMIVRISPGPLDEGIRQVQESWATIIPDWPMEYSFLDERIRAMYQAEQRLGRVFDVFSILALCIACLGMFGLAAFSAEQRTKEIGIRRALGAAATSIVVLLSSGFVRLVGLAFFVAAPIAWFVANRWLEGFAYRIDVGVVTILVVGALSLVLALATVSYQAVRASLADPVQALRYE